MQKGDDGAYKFICISSARIEAKNAEVSLQGCYKYTSLKHIPIYYMFRYKIVPKLLCSYYLDIVIRQKDDGNLGFYNHAIILSRGGDLLILTFGRLGCLVLSQHRNPF